MRKASLFIVTFILCLLPVEAQQVIENNFDCLKVHYATPDVKTLPVRDGYSLLQMEGYSQGGVHGRPSLPVQNNLIAVPFCDGMEVKVENAVFDTIAIEGLKVLPLQPSLPKSDRKEHPLFVDDDAYAADVFWGQSLASVQNLGVGRDRNYATLSFSPVSVNPVSGQMVVCRSADVTVSYRNADVATTMEHLQRYHSPAFGLGSTLNTMPGAKSVSNSAPLRMVIVVGQGLQCHAIQEFAEWKRTQGMLVDILVPSSYNTLALTNTLKDMYTNASESSPAPTYVLLVGDVAQMPVYSTKVANSFFWQMQLSKDHATDLYYATWSSGDNLPDCYLGRFSASDTATLRNIVAKTLYYEQYRFFDDSYLAKAALVAGEDQGSTGDNAYRCADPTMDYVAYYYVNAANGFNTVRYYKNNTSFYPSGVTVTGSSQSTSSATALKSYYSVGAGWINYSAHGDWNMWYKPQFTVSDVSRMSNVNMPSVMIGNCCLTNRFNETTCFGEALLRKNNNAGAVIYIGATNSTFWDQDFYWSVGLRDNISNTMSPSYIAAKMGTYDRLFHTHGEALSDYAVTAGKMLYFGNMSVQNAPTASSNWYGTTAEMKQYYWEIYELMGDPSLMTWLGRAEVLNLTLSSDGTSLRVAAAPGAYVALIANDGLQLQAAGFAGSDGLAWLPVPSVGLENCFVSVSAQGYRPVQKACTPDNLAVDGMGLHDVGISPNPASDHAVVSAVGLQHVALIDMTGRTLQTLPASGDRCRLDLSGVPAGLYLLRLVTANGSSTGKLLVK